MKHDPKRRELIKATLAFGGVTVVPSLAKGKPDQTPITKPIPSTGERIPVIGMGTFRTFNVGNDLEAIKARSEVLSAFYEHGGGMVDSSPMYGSSEQVMGRCIQILGHDPSLFSATKVWTWGQSEGREQIADSYQLWGLDRFDLFQVHNLVAWEDHLPYLLELKQAGKLRYVGITTSHGRQHEELAELMRSQPLDFVQLSYSLGNRDVENTLLPLARERGIAIIANRPFQGGYLVDEVQHHPLPPWAADIGCENWPQFLLKFIVSHPAVTCAIPATSRVAHMRENMGAASGEMPDAAMRKRMIDYFEKL